MSDTIRTWLICLVSRRVCRWLWLEERIPLGHWGPFILMRTLGPDVSMGRVEKHEEPTR